MFNLTTYQFSAFSSKQFTLQAWQKFDFDLCVKSLINPSMLIRFTQNSMLVFVSRPPMRVQNFSKIKARTHELWRFLQSVWNDEEETKKFLQNFADSYLGNSLRDLVEIWNMAYHLWRLTPL